MVFQSAIWQGLRWLGEGYSWGTMASHGFHQIKRVFIVTIMGKPIMISIIHSCPCIYGEDKGSMCVGQTDNINIKPTIGIDQWIQSWIFIIDSMPWLRLWGTNSNLRLKQQELDLF